ncbi:MAG: cyclase family protein [Actinomycetota bacterium]
MAIAGNTGTYLNAPFHRFRHREDLSARSLEAVTGLPGLVLDAAPARGYPVGLDVDDEALTGRAVLVRTGWDERWGTNGYWRDAPCLPAAAVARLVAGRAAIVGGAAFPVRAFAEVP